MRKIPKKNYLILVLVTIVSVGLTFYARSWYITAKEYYSNNSVIKEVASEINEVDIGSYTIETPSFVLYASSGTMQELKEFEKDLKDIINQLDIQNNVVYLNLDSVNIQTFKDTLKKYASNDKIASQITENTYSAIYIFSDGKIKYILNGANEYSKTYLKSLLESWGYSND